MSDKDRGWKKLQAAVKRNAKGAHVVIGLLSDGKPRTEGGPLTNAQIGAVHEFGSSDGHVPRRSFIRAAIDANPKKYEVFIRRRALAVMLGEMTEQQALGQIGALVRGDIVKLIASGIDPPLAASTLAKKTVDGKVGTTPLINTGQLRASITFQVRPGEEEKAK